MLSRRSVPGPHGPSAKRPRRPLPLGPATRDVQHVRPHACMTRAARARLARFHPHPDGSRANAHAATNLARNPLPLPGFVTRRNRRAGDGRRDAREPAARRLSRSRRRYHGRQAICSILHRAAGRRAGYRDIKISADTAARLARRLLPRRQRKGRSRAGEPVAPSRDRSEVEPLHAPRIHAEGWRQAAFGIHHWKEEISSARQRSEIELHGDARVGPGDGGLDFPGRFGAVALGVVLASGQDHARDCRRGRTRKRASPNLIRMFMTVASRADLPAGGRGLPCSLSISIPPCAANVKISTKTSAGTAEKGGAERQEMCRSKMPRPRAGMGCPGHACSQRPSKSLGEAAPGHGRPGIQGTGDRGAGSRRASSDREGPALRRGRPVSHRRGFRLTAERKGDP